MGSDEKKAHKSGNSHAIERFKSPFLPRNGDKILRNCGWADLLANGAAELHGCQGVHADWWLLSGGAE